MYTAQRGGHLVIFSKTWPDKPPSAAQVYDRARFKAAADAWSNQTPALKARWETATKRTSLGISGYNLWMYHQLTADHAAVRTIERQSGLTLLP